MLSPATAALARLLPCPTSLGATWRAAQLMMPSLGVAVGQLYTGTQEMSTVATLRPLPAGLQPGQAKPDAPRYTPNVPTLVYVNDALQHIEIDPGIIKSILHPDREVTVQLPVALDNGEVQIFAAHLVQHNNCRGPFKGGLIFHQDVTLDGLRNLAAINTWKTALMDVPFGGAKLGVAVDPRSLSLREQEKITRKLVSALQQLLGPTVCVPAPDIGTDERHMSWIFDQYSRIRGYAPAVVSGKPIWLHGTAGRDIATGRGAAFIAQDFLKTLKKRVAGSSFIIQGFGKNGTAAASQLHEMGARVVGVSSSETAVYNEAGLDIPALKTHVAAGKYLAEFAGGTGVPNDHTFLEIPCDVVLPAAVAGTIDATTAPRLNCSAVVEGANAGITAAGDKVLADRGIPVCPDVLATGGGVVVSFFEWVMNMNNLVWDSEEMWRKQESMLNRAFRAVQAVADEKGVSLRTAAYCVALQRLARADDHRGHG